jgi:transposase
LAIEGCTGWRFIAEECRAAGVAIHVADPAEAAALRGNKRRAKTDRLDARRLRELLENRQIPESWIPPTFVLEVHTKARLYKDLLDKKAACQHRMHATMFHQGVPKADGDLLRKGRAQAGRDDVGRSPAGRQAIGVALAMIGVLDAVRSMSNRSFRRHPTGAGGPAPSSHHFCAADEMSQGQRDQRHCRSSRHSH